jgi:hypothetical protein
MDHVVRGLKKVVGIRSTKLIDLNIKTLQCGIDRVTIQTGARKAA